jgi:hypothetical protein
MTGDATKPMNDQLRYRNCFDGLGRVVKEEGMQQLFRGLGPNLVSVVRRHIRVTSSTKLTLSVLFLGPFGADEREYSFHMDLRDPYERESLTSRSAFLRSRRPNWSRESTGVPSERAPTPSSSEPNSCLHSRIYSYDWFKDQLKTHAGMREGLLLHAAASLGAGTVATSPSSPGIETTCCFQPNHVLN